MRFVLFNPPSLVLALFLSPAFVQAQLSNGQFYTPALTILDSPSSSTPIIIGQTLNIAVDVSGNGQLPSAGFTYENNLQTGYEALELYLIGGGVNLTISGGSALLKQEAGSNVKHIGWTVPSCLSAGTYQLTIYETSHINSQSYFTISSVPLVLGTSSSTSSSSCSNQNIYQSGSQQSSPYPSSPWLSGLTIQTGSLAAGAQQVASTSSSAAATSSTSPAVQTQEQAKTSASVAAAQVASTTTSDAAKGTSTSAAAGTSTSAQSEAGTHSISSSITQVSGTSSTSSGFTGMNSVAGSITTGTGATSVGAATGPMASGQSNGKIDSSSTVSTGHASDSGTSAVGYGISYTTTLYGVVTEMVSLSPQTSTLLTLVEPTATYVTSLPRGKAAEQPWGVPLIAIVSKAETIQASAAVVTLSCLAGLSLILLAIG